MRQKLCPLYLTIGFLALFLNVAYAEDVEIGKPAPQLVIKEANGAIFDLTAMKGKPVIVHFWATWCAPCKEEMPALDKFYSSHKDISFIAVSVDSARRRGDAEEMLKMFSFPGGMMNDADKNGFGLPPAIPVTYVIDANGILKAQLRPDETKLTEKALNDALKN